MTAFPVLLDARTLAEATKASHFVANSANADLNVNLLVFAASGSVAYPQGNRSR